MADVDIPEWAKERAVELANEHRVGFAYRTDNVNPAFAALFALACHVAEYEEPPVDPLLLEARKLLAEDHRNGLIALAHPWGPCILKSGAGEDLILEGKYDHRREVSQYMAALKRGMELAQTEK